MSVSPGGTPKRSRSAVGGRHSLFGAIVAAVVLNYLQTELADISDVWQKAWLLILGGIFIAVVLLLPRGLAGAFEYLIGFIPGGGRQQKPAPRVEAG